MFDFLIKNKIKKICRKNGRAKCFLTLSKIQSVLILFETSDYEASVAFIEKLERMGKQVKACCYKMKDDRYDYSETPYTVIVPKIDTDSLGIPRKQKIDQLQKDHYDALIDLSVAENYIIEYIVASLNIPLKVGLKKNKLPLYDLSIFNLREIKDENTSKVTELGNQIVFYLDTIQSAV